MQTKLTLRLEDDLINKAKLLARKNGKSLSKIVAEYFAFITSSEISESTELPPVVKSLYGSMANVKIDESDYKNHLKKKHL